MRRVCTGVVTVLGLWLGSGLGALGSSPDCASLRVSKQVYGLRLDFSRAPEAAYLVQSSATVPTKYWKDVTEIAADSPETCALVQPSGGQEFYRILECTNQVYWYDWQRYYQQPLLTAWGLGAAEEEYVHVDRKYEWYIDQADTGQYSLNNCGPAAVAMALKWNDPDDAVSAAQIRRSGPTGGAWWSTADVINYLSGAGVCCTVTVFAGTGQLTELLRSGYLIVACLDTTELAADADPEHRVGRFYGFCGGHFMVIKGVRALDTGVFVEVYDSNNWRAMYGDKTPKGRNRHLPAEELGRAISVWWNYLIVVHPQADEAMGQTFSALVPVDARKIRHAFGR